MIPNCGEALIRSYTSIKKLEKTQNCGMRIITEEAKSVPERAMHIVTNNLPFANNFDSTKKSSYTVWETCKNARKLV